MRKFIDFMTDLGASIGGSLKASQMGGGIQAAGNAAFKSAKGMYQERIGSKIDAVGAKIDRFAFDSGKDADKARADKASQVVTDRKNRTTLKKAGDEAESKYKKENAAALAGKSPAEQNKMIQEHRNAAMIKKGNELGLSEAKSKELVEQKTGMKGNTLAEIAKNAWLDKGASKKSLAQKDVKTTFSGKQFSAAMKSANEEDKKKLAQAVDRGDLNVKVSFKDQADQSFDKAGEKFKDGNIGGAIASSAKGVAQSVASVGKNVGKVAGVVAATPFVAAASPVAAPVIAVKKAASYVVRRHNAIKDLEAKGEIPKRAFGTRWSGSAEEKSKIADRMQEITQEQSIQSEKATKQSADFADKSQDIQRSPLQRAQASLDRRKDYQSKLGDEKKKAEEKVNSGSDDEKRNAEMKIKKIDNELNGGMFRPGVNKKVERAESKVEKLTPKNPVDAG